MGFACCPLDSTPATYEIVSTFFVRRDLLIQRAADVNLRAEFSAKKEEADMLGVYTPMLVAAENGRNL